MGSLNEEGSAVSSGCGDQAHQGITYIFAIDVQYPAVLLEQGALQFLQRVAAECRTDTQPVAQPQGSRGLRQAQQGSAVSEYPSVPFLSIALCVAEIDGVVVHLRFRDLYALLPEVGGQRRLDLGRGPDREHELQSLRHREVLCKPDLVRIAKAVGGLAQNDPFFRDVGRKACPQFSRFLALRQLSLQEAEQTQDFVLRCSRHARECWGIILAQSRLVGLRRIYQDGRYEYPVDLAPGATFIRLAVQQTKR